MKNNNIIFTVMLSITVFSVLGFSSKEETIDLSHYKITDQAFVYHVPTQQEALHGAVVKKKPFFNLFLGKTFIGFKEALGFNESTGNYASINKYGYLGKYQFAAATLSLIGVHNPSAFVQNAALQERAFIAHTARNKWILRRDIKRFVGKRIQGILITESGILAAAHLAGAGNVKKYLRSDGVFLFEDAFGTTIHIYLKKFSGYDTSFIKPNKKAKAV
ncbi:MAG: hypothetical protein ACI9R6_000630 [Saprospiraceae bacterium]|jgi:hypothetical protein